MFESDFTQDPTISFLNAGTLSRVPLSVLSAMEKMRREGQANPTASLFLSYSRIWSVQKRIAEFLGADPKNLFLRHNITAAINDFFFALPLGEEDEILVTGWEYGGCSRVAKWRAQQSRLPYREAPLPLRPEIDEQEIVEIVTKAFHKNTKVLLLSHVATGTGAILPFQKIAEEAVKRGIIVVLDGAHAVGSLPLDLESYQSIDFYGGNLHKWFMGPTGTAFGWVHPKWRGKLEWKFGGWASFDVPGFYQDFAEGDSEAALRYFQGTIDPNPFLALEDTLQYWLEHGPEKIREAQRKRLLLCAELASQFGWERVTPEKHGPLVSFLAPKKWGTFDPTQFATRIYREARVQLALPVVQGTQLVRFSPGIYTSEAEIRSGMERLEAFQP